MNQNQFCRLLPSKFGKLTNVLEEWAERKVCTKEELCSHIGPLSHAEKVVKPGRLFYRFIIDLSKTVKSYNHRIYLNKSAATDIFWWHRFVCNWNRVDFFRRATIGAYVLLLSSDAKFSGNGAV